MDTKEETLAFINFKTPVTKSEIVSLVTIYQDILPTISLYSENRVNKTLHGY